jgi:ATP-dependent Clp protease protease subunit
MSAWVPMVVESTGRGERGYDIFSRLLKDRIVFLGTPINDNIASLVIAQVLFLYHEDKQAEIELYINSPGGLVTSGLAIYDVMQFVECDVSTTCIGEAASIATLLLAAGTKGKRAALPHARVHLHQPWGAAGGQATDIRIQAQEMLRIKRQVTEILARHTGREVVRIEKDVERDFFMTPEQAKEYGVIDEVLTSDKSSKGD